MKLNLLCVLCVLGGSYQAALQRSAAAEDNKPHVVFVVGDDEYRSEVSMPMIAKILEARHGMRCSVASAQPKPQTKDNIEGLDALDTADLAVIYVRFRALPDEQLKKILKYAESGKPLIGLRTSTHAFRYPNNSEHVKLNDSFGRDVFGQKWITHHGHESTTAVEVIPDKKDHPILRGVAPKLDAASWLYHVEPLVGDCERLLTGKAIKSNKTAQAEKFPLEQPVAWTKSHNGARVFFTTLGHPKDFENESMRRLLINGIYWTLGKDVPAGGADATIEGEYVAPPTT